MNAPVALGVAIRWRAAHTQPINHVDGDGGALRLMAGDRNTTVDCANRTRLCPSHSHAWRGDLGHVGVLTSMAGLFRRPGGMQNVVTAFVSDAPAPGSRALVPSLDIVGAGE